MSKTSSCGQAACSTQDAGSAGPHLRHVERLAACALTAWVVCLLLLPILRSVAFSQPPTSSQAIRSALDNAVSLHTLVARKFSLALDALCTPGKPPPPSKTEQEKELFTFLRRLSLPNLAGALITREDLESFYTVAAWYLTKKCLVEQECFHTGEFADRAPNTIEGCRSITLIAEANETGDCRQLTRCVTALSWLLSSADQSLACRSTRTAAVAHHTRSRLPRQACPDSRRAQLPAVLRDVPAFSTREPRALAHGGPLL